MACGSNSLSTTVRDVSICLSSLCVALLESSLIDETDRCLAGTSLPVRTESAYFALLRAARKHAFVIASPDSRCASSDLTPFSFSHSASTFDEPAHRIQFPIGTG